jgi:hypothetical protein
VPKYKVVTKPKSDEPKELIAEDWISYDEAVVQWKTKYPKSETDPKIKYEMKDWKKTTKMTEKV